MDFQQARFGVGQLIQHKLFDYRGVVIDVDPCFMGTDDWYQQVARSRPPKEAPWYRVLVHNASHETYVAERNLYPDSSSEPIFHPSLESHFIDFRDGIYISDTLTN